MGKATVDPTSAAFWRGREVAIAAVAGVLGSIAVFSKVPGTTSRFLGTQSIGSLLAAACFGYVTLIALRRVRRFVWRWALPVGAFLALLQVLGASLAVRDDLPFRRLADWQGPLQAVIWVGFAAVFATALAVIWEVALRSVAPGRADPRPAGASWAGRFLTAIRQVRRGPVAALFGVMLAARLPAFAVWFPGVVPFDTFRSYAYVRGTSPWDAYEPVGHTMLTWLYDRIGTALGMGDTGKVAIAVAVQILLMAGAFTFLLVRIAVWGVPRIVWWSSAAFLGLFPIFGIFAVTELKDVPFALALLVFVVAIGEIAVRRTSARWPWVTMAVAQIVAILMRNNGIHVVLLSLAVLLVALRGQRMRVLVVGVVAAVAYVIYVGPVYSAIGVGPDRTVETLSVPIQQVARIAKASGESFTPAERRYVAENFDGVTPEQLGKVYDAGVADKPKDLALQSWDRHGTGEFLSGWLRLAAAHPTTAGTATLAGTVGYWYPDAPLRDVTYTWSRNDIRGVHLDIPSGPPKPGLRRELVDASLLAPDKANQRRGMVTPPGYLGPEFRTIPVLGQLVSPGLMAWAWLVAAIGLVITGLRRRLAVVVPVLMLYLTVLACPVSGSIRYTLLLFVAAPLTAAILTAPAEARPAHERVDQSAG